MWTCMHESFNRLFPLVIEWKKVPSNENLGSAVNLAIWGFG